MTSPIDCYAVMGNPVAHSKSPEIQHTFATQCQQNIHYDKILVAIDDFENAVINFQKLGGKGLNITLPFKQRAYALADQCSERAQLAEAVNTIIFKDNKIIGDNTDGAGLVNDLINNQQMKIAGLRILIIGASGAARGVIGPLWQQHPALIHIANRTEQKAVELAAHFNNKNITASGFTALKIGFDLIINATSSSIQGIVPDVPTQIFHHDSFCYDMYYADSDTAFVKWAKANGAKRAVDGLGMLVEQAAEAFYVWRGVRPQTTAVIQQLR